MLSDRYGNPLSTRSAAARDAYVKGVDRTLSANAGVEGALHEALEHDESFALAHLALARHRQVLRDSAGAREALGIARGFATNLTDRETGQLETLGLLIEGKSAAGYTSARAHLDAFPRDAMVAQTCLGVFGLIGFNGQPGREAENLALAENLAPHYGDDWWMLGNLAFAQMEAGQTGPAEISVERSIALNPANANAAHYRSHLYYELGETAAGLQYLEEWSDGYHRDGILHCHMSWHIALWALAQGDVNRMWHVVDADIDPEKSSSPPLNVLTDLAAILYRADVAGVDIAPERWRRLSEFASQRFGKTGLAFADVHAALAHAMAGRGEAVTKIIAEARGPAADMVRVLAEGFSAIARGDWHSAAAQLTTAMADHARIGGSRAQRDLIEYAMVNILLKLGQGDEARRMLAMRRPMTATAGTVRGL
jgi:tetratricopeptide (TPR) repeat protein